MNSSGHKVGLFKINLVNLECDGGDSGFIILWVLQICQNLN